jgi:hypothetical protein
MVRDFQIRFPLNTDLIDVNAVASNRTHNDDVEGIDRKADGADRTNKAPA